MGGIRDRAAQTRPSHRPGPSGPAGRAHLQPLQDAVGAAVEHHERVVLAARDDVPVVGQQRQHRAGVQPPALQQRRADFRRDAGRGGTSGGTRTPAPTPLGTTLALLCAPPSRPSPLLSQLGLGHPAPPDLGPPIPPSQSRPLSVQRRPQQVPAEKASTCRQVGAKPPPHDTPTRLWPHLGKDPLALQLK